MACIREGKPAYEGVECRGWHVLVHVLKHYPMTWKQLTLAIAGSLESLAGRDSAGRIISLTICSQKATPPMVEIRKTETFAKVD